VSPVVFLLLDWKIARGWHDPDRSETKRRAWSRANTFAICCFDADPEFATLIPLVGDMSDGLYLSAHPFALITYSSHRNSDHKQQTTYGERNV
jgi:hypothetical protein